jgi:ATP/maltotriose-dependent transcriptional regulator MalT
VYHVELACLRGAWADAEVEARRACSELVAFDARYAGEAYYLVGELCRLRGDLDGSDGAYGRAHELGRVPQPGLALSIAARGRHADAATMLETALPTSTAPLPRARLLAELVDLEVGLGRVAPARPHVDELAALAGELRSALVLSLAEGAAGRLRDAEGDHRGGYELLHRAVDRLGELHIPYEAARLRLAASRAAGRCGDRQTARLEARTALGAFQRLGAEGDVAGVTAWLDAIDAGRLDDPSGTARLGHGSPLTDREIEVLRLIAAGSTNREIAAELHLSPHTVGRHLSNIFTKIDVSSRAAATAYAYEHDLVDANGRQ